MLEWHAKAFVVVVTSDYILGFLGCFTAALSLPRPGI